MLTCGTGVVGCGGTANCFARVDGFTYDNGTRNCYIDYSTLRVAACRKPCGANTVTCVYDGTNSPAIHVDQGDVANYNCRLNSSPVIIDLVGDGFRLSAPDGGAAFDLDNNGLREYTAWTAANSDDAFLALDRDGDGQIKGGAELFGDHTAQPASWQPNGFSALAVFDANSDNKIDVRDAIYSSLRLWLDQNQDGKSEASELSPLAARGVTAIRHDFKRSSKHDRHGNEFRYRAKVEGTRGQPFAYDVFLVPTAKPSN